MRNKLSRIREIDPTKKSPLTRLKELKRERAEQFRLKKQRVEFDRNVSETLDLLTQLLTPTVSKSFEWKCPQCGSGYDGQSGLVCECSTSEQMRKDDHGEVETNPCTEAHCYGCNWAGTLPRPTTEPTMESIISELRKERGI